MFNVYEMKIDKIIYFNARSLGTDGHFRTCMTNKNILHCTYIIIFITGIPRIYRFVHVI